MEIFPSGLDFNKLGFAVIKTSHLSQIVIESIGKYVSLTFVPNFDKKKYVLPIDKPYSIGETNNTSIGSSVSISFNVFSVQSFSSASRFLVQTPHFPNNSNADNPKITASVFSNIEGDLND